LGAVGTQQRFIFLDLEFSSNCSSPTSMLINFQAVSPLCKTLYHLNTALQPKASLPYTSLIIWNVLLTDCLIFGRTWRFLIAQIVTFSISTSRRQLPFTTMTFFFNTLHAHNCFLLRPEKNGHGIISWLHVVHNATVQAIHEIIDCTT
jgi:hypothetical protein